MPDADYEAVNEHLDGLDYIDGYEWNSGRVTVFYPEGYSHSGNKFHRDMERLGYRVNRVNFRDRGIEFIPRRGA